MKTMEEKPKIEGNKLTITIGNFPFKLNPEGVKFQPIQIQINSSIIRRRHIKVNSEVDLLDSRVAKLYFKKEVNMLKKKAEVYKSIWSIKEIYFPNIFLNIFSLKGKILFILSINLKNYNYYPPEFGLLTKDMKILKKIDSKYVIPDKNGYIHIKNHNQGLWFCTPGTYKYHDFYFDIDRWELERYNTTCDLVETINRIIGMIDRSQD